MVKQQLLIELKENFDFTLEIPEILGVVLYGSHVNDDDTDRSDVDICIITEKTPTLEIWNKLMVLQPSPKEKYSIFFFHELPLYIKKDIFTDGIVITSPDIPKLYEFYFPYRKIWQDESYIIKNA